MRSSRELRIYTRDWRFGAAYTMSFFATLSLLATAALLPPQAQETSRKSLPETATAPSISRASTARDDEAAHLIEVQNPAVELLGGGAARITWSTPEPSTSRVEFGLTPALGSLRETKALVSEHAVTLTGLPLDRIVHYAIGASYGVTTSDSATAPAYQSSFFNGTSGVGATAFRGSGIAWYPLTLSFQGPFAREGDSNPNPFLDYRLIVDFRGPSGQTYSVPGFFDGNGSGGGAGTTWKVRFAPDEGGAWSYTASFRSGTAVAISQQPNAGVPAAFNGETGTFQIGPRDPQAPGFYRHGLLEYVGGHYLKFRDGPYFIKGGTDSPENFLGYAGIDNTFDQGGQSTSGLTNGLHRYPSHRADFGPGGLGDSGDPLFSSQNTGYDSRGIIGALNYLESVNINSIYFLPMNLGGDGQDTYPFINPNGSFSANTHYDISKLDQWNQVFEHATKCGILLHVVLAETEFANENWLDNGNLGTERKLFYRELIARFGHNLAIKWNICEETDYTPSEVKAFAGYIRQVDPYDHPIATHSNTLPSSGNLSLWSNLLGDARISMSSIQGFGKDAGKHVEKWRQDSAASGRKWVIDHDEQNESLTPQNAVEMRKKTLYDVYFSGGHIEWYAGYYNLPVGGDLRMEDFRQRQAMWNYTWHARRLMQKFLPFWEMEPRDGLVQGESSEFGGAECFAKVNDAYAVYFPSASATGRLNLVGTTGSFRFAWYRPATGKFAGKIGNVQGNQNWKVPAPPFEPNQDWVLVLKR